MYLESALIVSSTQKSIAFIRETLSAVPVTHICAAESCSQARRLLLERDFDLVVINAPLGDESGEGLAMDTAQKGVSQVILIVKSEFFDAVSAVCEQGGVLTVAKPLNRALFWSALTMAKSAHIRIGRMREENARLKRKLDDIRIIERAKYILIAHMKMDERQAHRHIEKQAMDMRSTRRAIAEEILNRFENCADANNGGACDE